MRSVLLLAFLAALARSQEVVSTNMAAASDCTTFCMNQMEVCPDVYSDWWETSAALAPAAQTACENWCKTTAATGLSATAGDNLACRVYHLNAANGTAANAKTTHCPHTSPAGGGVCVNDDGVYGSFCNQALLTCTGANQIYDNYADCLGMSGVWPAGLPSYTIDATNTVIDSTDDSFSCRWYHLRVASVPANTDAHCAHADFFGGNACGIPCEAYCDLEDHACSTATSNDMVFFDAAGTIDRDRCLEECMYYPNSDLAMPFNMSITGGDSFDCRVYHLGAAWGNGVATTTTMNTHCPHSQAFGGGVCGMPCDHFCDKEDYVCDLVYDSHDDCLTACMYFPGASEMVYDDTEAGDNSFNCRFYHQSVASWNDGNATVHCPHTNWDGGDGVCGDALDYYCDLEDSVCGSNYPTHAECLQWAGYLPRDIFNDPAITTSGDSLECRVYHAQVAGQQSTQSGMDTHCSHSNFYSFDDVCGTQCEAFCDAESAVCGFAVGDDVKFADQQNCWDLCGAWPAGASGDTSGDSLGCREYHVHAAAGSAAGAATTHCPHTYDDGGAAPTQYQMMSDAGDGVCGNGCDQFCTLVMATCTGANAQYGSDMTTCTDACATWPYGTRGEAAYNTFSCRYYHAWAAVDAPATHCPHTAVASAVCTGMEPGTPTPMSSTMMPSSTAPAGTGGLSGSGVAPLSVFGAFLAVIAALML